MACLLPVDFLQASLLPVGRDAGLVRLYGKWARCQQHVACPAREVRRFQLGLSDDVIPCVVDINPHKQGTFLPATGQAVVSPTYLQGYQPDVVIVMNPVYREEIWRSLQELGVGGEVLAL